MGESAVTWLVYASSRVEVKMLAILACIALYLLALSSVLLKQDELSNGNWLPTTNNIAKREFETYALGYTVLWILAFTVVIATQAFESFDENNYISLCVSLALPFLLQPILFPSFSESNMPIYLRYSFKANLWIAIFSFIGNYWYTHYFYSVLNASYTFPSHRLNNVPIALYFATHFYFVTYHTFSNLLLRKIETCFVPGKLRTLYFWSVIFAFSYFTAFMETLTISSFPYYSFQDRDMAYTVGSAFYGLYFIVSFPVFYRIDEKTSTISRVDNKEASLVSIIPPYSIFQVIMEAMGSGMIVLLLLDVCRLALNIPLVIPGKAFYIFRP